MGEAASCPNKGELAQCTGGGLECALTWILSYGMAEQVALPCAMCVSKMYLPPAPITEASWLRGSHLRVSGWSQLQRLAVCPAFPNACTTSSLSGKWPPAGSLASQLSCEATLDTLGF